MIIKGSALRLFKSYLSDRYNFVDVNDESSRYDKVSHGVPQGTVLGPYILLLGKIIRKSSRHFNCYADDTQLYLSIKLDETHQLANLQTCLKEIKNCMSHNFLMLS